MLAAFLKILLNIMLIGSMLAFVTCSVMVTLGADNVFERLIRFGALFSGGLVVLGAQVGGVGFSQFIVNALSSSGALGTTAGVVVSGAAGASIGLLLLKTTYRGSIFAIRIMIFIGMLAATQFAEIYVSAFKKSGFSLGPAVVPNISFVVGILLCIALTYDPKDPSRGPHLLEQFRSGRLDHIETRGKSLGADPRRNA